MLLNLIPKVSVTPKESPNSKSVAICFCWSSKSSKDASPAGKLIWSWINSIFSKNLTENPLNTLIDRLR